MDEGGEGEEEVGEDEKGVMEERVDEGGECEKEG